LLSSSCRQRRSWQKLRGTFLKRISQKRKKRKKEKNEMGAVY
jgi:hypothetical protein